MKKLAVLIYPECSIQEVSNLMYLFRWYYDTQSVMVSTSKNIVRSEEGILIQPEVVVDDFNQEDYYALVLPGISDFREAIADEKLIEFLKGFKENKDFTIGAICAGPILLSLAGLLDDKNFTNSLYMDMNEMFPFIKNENLKFEPVVVDGNIVTAVGRATRLFAIEVARNCGLKCEEDVLKELTREDLDQELYQHYLPLEDVEKIKKEFSHLLKLV